MNTKNTKSSTLKKLYNAIKQDYSIRKYSLGSSDIIEAIEKKYKRIPTIPQSFENSLLAEAICVSTGLLREKLETFARELNMNIESIGYRQNAFKR